MNHRQNQHAMLPTPTHDENARQDFVQSFRRHLSRRVAPGAYLAFERRVEPALTRKLGRKPESADEIRPAMQSDPLYQMWSALQRQSQEMIWDSAIDTIERERPALAEKAKAPAPLGSLRLNPELETPRYHSVYDIHLQPGGYHSNSGDDDVVAGAIYDLGVPIYAMGMMGTQNDSTGQTIVNFVQTAYPDWQPERILDLGCAIGNSTVPWAQAFPHAEVHGIDVGAACLRYGHARANALGAAVHLSQQNAEQLDFEDDSLDLVVSALLFHETSRAAVPRILGEAHRVLKPGGRMIHLDGFTTTPVEPIHKFFGEWEIYNNNEAFLKTVQKMDWVAECAKAGFAADDVALRETPFVAYKPLTKAGTKGYMTGFGDVPVLVARKAA